MKAKIENRIGIILTDGEFEKAKGMAEAKKQYLLKNFGDANGMRNTEDYLEELIYEAALHNAFSDATMEIARLLIDMKKECLENQNTLTRNHILA